MSKADELLNSLSEDDISLQLATPETEPHIVIGEDRVISVPEELRRIAVQYDHDVETVTFDCPRYWDGLDMSELSIYINYMRKDRYIDCYKATDIVVDGTDPNIMHFNWTVSRNVSEVKGELKFLVCIKKDDSEGYEVNHWNSELNAEMYISEGLEVDPSILDPYPDIISQWEDEVQRVKDILLAARDAGEFDGATFTPNVDDDGNLSWTNDKGRPNPATKNVKGYSPTVTTESVTGGTKITITDKTGAKSFIVSNGANGIDGVSPTVATAAVTGGTEVTITDKNGSKIFTVLNGVDGTNGNDGVSPTVVITDINGGHRVTITDKDGTKSFDVMDGTTEISEAVKDYIGTYMHVGEVEPTSGPVLWFDTSTQTTE